VSFRIIVTTSVTRPCFTTQHQTFKSYKTKTVMYKTKSKTNFFGLRPVFVLRPTVSDHITALGVFYDLHAACMSIAKYA